MRTHGMSPPLVNSQSLRGEMARAVAASRGFSSNGGRMAACSVTARPLSGLTRDGPLTCTVNQDALDCFGIEQEAATGSQARHTASDCFTLQPSNRDAQLSCGTP
jgi:hypothetical protein